MKTKSMFRSMLAIFALCMAFAFTSCNDEPEITSVVYTMGFDKTETTALNEIAEIENIYKSALGVNESPFTLQGTVKDCDKKVVEACKTAETRVRARSWKGKYIFKVYNAVSNKDVHVLELNTDI